jgi:hypothetical protein
MATKKKGGKKAAVIKKQPNLLAGRQRIPRTNTVYALPYYTHNGSDTEYLISNPNTNAQKAKLIFYGKKCQAKKTLSFTLKPNCTYNIKIRTIVPEHAGHAILIVVNPVVVHILYIRSGDFAVVGGELAGTDNLFKWLPTEKSRTYGFGYRSLALGHDTLEGAVYISNPYPTTLTGKLIFYDQKCKVARRHRVSIKPGCTYKYPFPKVRYGYGRIQLSRQAVINVLNFTASSKGIAAAELVGETNRIDGPAETPSPRTKILFDDTHNYPEHLSFYSSYEAALSSAGCTVAHHTSGSLTLSVLQQHHVLVVIGPYSEYSASEKIAITSFVNGGGGLMIVGEWSFYQPLTVALTALLNIFGANYDDNQVVDPTNYEDQTYYVLYDNQRNFLPHSIVDGLTQIKLFAGSSLSGGDGWTTIIETDDDSVPARRPIVICRPFGAGRIVAFCDSSFLTNVFIQSYDNEAFGLRCAEWLLFRI